MSDSQTECLSVSFLDDCLASLPVSQNKNFLLTKFEGCTVRYLLCFFHFNLWPSVKQDSHELKWKKIGAITYSTDKKMRLRYDVKSNSWNLNSAGSIPQSQVVHSLDYRLLNHSGHST